MVRKNFLGSLFGSVLVTSCSLNSSAQIQNSVIPTDVQNLQIGVGYDSKTKSPRNHCTENVKVNQTLSTGELAPPVQSIENYYTAQTSFDRVILDIKKSGSASGIYDIITGDLSGSSSHHSDTSKIASVIVVGSEVLHQPLSLEPGARLKKEYEGLYLYDREEFIRQCGNEFVSGYVEGGRYAAEITIDAVSQEQIDEVRGSAGVGLEGMLGASVDFKKTLHEIHKRFNSHTKVSILGGNYDQSISYDLPGLIAFAEAFPSKIAKSPWKLEAHTTRYEDIAGYLVGRPSSDEQRDFGLSQMRAQRKTLEQFVLQANDVLRNSERYNAVDLMDLKSRLAIANADIHALLTRASECESNAARCELPGLSAISTALPSPVLVSSAHLIAVGLEDKPNHEAVADCSQWQGCASFATTGLIPYALRGNASKDGYLQFSEKQRPPHAVAMNLIIHGRIVSNSMDDKGFNASILPRMAFLNESREYIGALRNEVFVEKKFLVVQRFDLLPGTTSVQPRLTISEKAFDDARVRGFHIMGVHIQWL